MDNNTTVNPAEDQPRKRQASNRFEEPSDDEVERPATAGRTGRRKIKIEYIQDKPRRQITFSKRKSGIMKKARRRYIANINYLGVRAEHADGNASAVVVGVRDGTRVHFCHAQTPAHDYDGRRKKSYPGLSYQHCCRGTPGMS